MVQYTIKYDDMVQYTIKYDDMVQYTIKYDDMVQYTIKYDDIKVSTDLFGTSNDLSTQLHFIGTKLHILGSVKPLSDVHRLEIYRQMQLIFLHFNPKCYNTKVICK
jgi:hypothetical protein